MHRGMFLIALGLGMAGGVGTGRTALAQEDAPQHQHMSGMPSVTETAGAPLYDNLGSLHYGISTKNPAAQQYFDQGLRLTWGFNHDEAIASYTEATRNDSTCAMCWWGIAFALGPNINAPMAPAAVKPAWEALQNAQKYAAKATPRERDFIAALAKRYSSDSTAARPPLDSAFTKAMGAVAKKYPSDPEAQTVYADAIMNLSPWNYYTDRGAKLRPQTAELVSTLERTIKKYPNHPGACHLYIHAVEASTTPARAVPCADRLAQLMPGAGHLVHMPSHIYMRTGRYDLVAAHNHDAVGQDETFIQDRKPAGFYKYMYYPHNYHMMYAGLMALGRGQETIAAARKIVEVVPAEVTKQVPPLEYFFPTPYWALARFEHWDELLAEPAPAAHINGTPPACGTTPAVWRSPRRASSARRRPSMTVSWRSREEIPKEQPAGINQAKTLLQLAERHGAGRLAAAQGDTASAIAAYEAAMKIEDNLVYDEPPAWYHPIRLELGAVKTGAGQGGGGGEAVPGGSGALEEQRLGTARAGGGASAPRARARRRRRWRRSSGSSGRRRMSSSPDGETTKGVSGVGKRER